jgi:hypothetical protein
MSGVGLAPVAPEDRPETRAVHRRVALVALGGLTVAACTPTVQLKAPEEPITINLNIQADVRVKIEEAAQQDIKNNPEIFGE